MTCTVTEDHVTLYFIEIGVVIRILWTLKLCSLNYPGLTELGLGLALVPQSTPLRHLQGAKVVQDTDFRCWNPFLHMSGII